MVICLEATRTANFTAAAHDNDMHRSLWYLFTTFFFSSPRTIRCLKKPNQFVNLNKFSSMANNGNDNVGCEDGLCRPRGSAAKTTGARAEAKDASKKCDRDKRIKIDIISDTMCPWCWVGKRNLESALRDMPDIEADINWLPYFLDKHLPENGKPVEEYYLGNYGDPRAGDRMKPALVAAGKRCGIDFETHYIHMTHYRPTIRSHRLIHLAKRHNKQDEMVEELFRIYYEEGKHLNSIDHLSEAASKVGLDNTIDIKAYLGSKEDEDDVFYEARKVKHLAHGVPTFIFTKPGSNFHHTFSGGQPPSAFKMVFEMFLSEDNSDQAT